MLSNTVMKNLLSAAWKNSSRPKIGQFELFSSIFVSLLSVSYASENTSQQNTAELESRVKSILAQDNISQRLGINDIFKLADIYVDQNEMSKARELYEKGLAIDSFRFDCQLKLANLMKASGDVNQAIEKYKSIYSYAEDESLIISAKDQLSLFSFHPPQPQQKDSDFSIAVIPIGEVNNTFMAELLSGLNQAVGIKYSLTEEAIPLGNIDRSYAAHRLSQICAKIKSENPNLNTPPDTDPHAQFKLTLDILKSQNVPQDTIDQFSAMITKDFQHGQHNADHLLSKIKARFGSNNEPNIIGFLGVTESDIYSRDNNFLFGWGGHKFAVMSCHRFRADFNEEPPYRPRLIKRALKQGISSTFFILGIARCNNAMCARAYPNSLEEQDMKECELCSWCKEQLSKKLTNGNK